MGNSRARGAGRRPGLVVALALAAVLAGGACNELDRALNVATPSQIPADGLAVPKNAELLVNGAIGDFECGFGAYVALSAMMAHEMVDATQTAARWPYDRREVRTDDALYGADGCTSLGVYTPLSTARWSADNILGHLQDWTDTEVSNRQELIAKAAVYAGYSYVLLGEGFCTMAIDLSGELSTTQVLDSAVARFGTAIAAAQSSGQTDLLNFAYVGRARAYLDQGNTQSALADAQKVPADFVYDATASTASTRRNNRVYAQNGVGTTGGDALSVGDEYRSVTFDGVPDPRVTVEDAHRTATEGTPIFFQRKYNSLSDPLPIASGTEAQLIIAEVQGGTTAVDIINQLHNAVGLPTFSSADPQTIADQVIQERDRELWLTGHRFFDIRRLDLPLVPAPGTPYRKGGTYGSARCLPLPDVEVQNNPNISG